MRGDTDHVVARRITLRDIAERAGVSEAAASFALNGRPGVSEATRERVKSVAEEMQWQPSYAAKVLSGARSQTIGMVISRTAQSIGSEAFFLRLMTGVQDVLARRHYALLLQVISSAEEEIETYRRWQAERRVDGVVLVDLKIDDPRPRAIAEMGLPCVLAGGPDPSRSVSAVVVDDAGAMEVILRHLRDRDYASDAYVT